VTDPATAADAQLSRYLTERGLKHTRQRTLIVETFVRGGGHLSVDEIVSTVKQQDARVSVATVYRTMKLLAECGVASALDFGDGQVRYEPAAGRHHHDHLVCTGCGQVVEFENDRIEALQRVVAKRHGFAVTSHRMELYGTCHACQASGRAPPS
jgi:Fur family ferric uptake transcriptional regulator